MAKVVCSWDVDQGWLLPPSLHEFVPPGHMVHFVRDTVREALDLSAILDTYTEERGYPPYHPGMMVALLLYGYSRGLYSSRQLGRACEELCRRHGRHRPEPARLPYHRRVPQASPRGLVGPVRAGAAPVSGGRSGRVRPRGGGRDQAISQRLAPQSDELRADEDGRAGPGR